ncbi:hypothetical protein BJ875DRAFT_371617 [Amylocarpus encephaloides]|uniref:Zn(2)-C6 fungal-type domain-containing protein n=1 Tax=Amylocarpus encephaloides TaxID=45428 RepID=A0A9P7YN87_9HELO|nr:hypothetical protein BJ875DRAFT_371617 [Amylocarpus encephaloides]
MAPESPTKPQANVHRRRRQCGPKTRTGCQTCKIRRVKCDEAKPFCSRCTSTGRTCDGYLNSSSQSSPRITCDGTIAMRPSSQVPGNSQEKRAFAHFITQTSPELNGFYSSGFWDALLPQVSLGEPSLRHAVIAISSLHEDFAGKSMIKYPGKGDNAAFTLNQYTKALGHLRRSLATGKQAPMMALMSCILFVCFDSLRGYYQTAIVHLQSGMRILRDLRSSGRPIDPLIEDVIAPLLLRLGLQSILYIDTSEPHDRATFARELTQAVPQGKSVPDVFPSLEEARSSLNECCDGLFRMFYLCDGSLPMCCQSLEAHELLRNYAAKIMDWNRSFEKFMSLHSPSFTSRQVRGAALLKIHHTIVRIMSDVAPSMRDQRAIAEATNDAQQYTHFNHDFQIIINLSRSLITAAEQDARHGKPALTFSSDMGIIGPLYYVGVKCQVPSLKREAMDLLQRCPRKEGMWDSVTAVNLVHQFWEMEERQRALNTRHLGDESIDVPLNEVVDLVFYEGGEWQWVWKELVPPNQPLSSGRLQRLATPTSIYSQFPA